MYMYKYTIRLILQAYYLGLYLVTHHTCTKLTEQGLVSCKLIKPGPLLATRTKFDNQKWSRVRPILAAKYGPPGPLFTRTNFRVTLRACG